MTIWTKESNTGGRHFMEISKAIMAFSQSEKIKAGLIWSSQVIELLRGVPEEEKKGVERVAGTLLSMVAHEADLAKIVAGQVGWDEISSYLEKAKVMIHSGVGQEVMPHISQALSRATTIGHRSMTFLKEKSLL
jgi:hypothetical protein